VRVLYTTVYQRLDKTKEYHMDTVERKHKILQYDIVMFKSSCSKTGKRKTCMKRWRVHDRMKGVNQYWLRLARERNDIVVETAL
jgi:hypothetical protein